MGAGVLKRHEKSCGAIGTLGTSNATEFCASAFDSVDDTDRRLVLAGVRVGNGVGGPFADMLDVVVVREMVGRSSESEVGGSAESSTISGVALSLAVSFFKASSLCRCRVSGSVVGANTSSPASSDDSGVVGKLSHEAEWYVALDVTDVVVVS